MILHIALKNSVDFSPLAAIGLIQTVLCIHSAWLRLYARENKQKKILSCHKNLKDLITPVHNIQVNMKYKDLYVHTCVSSKC